MDSLLPIEIDFKKSKGSFVFDKKNNEQYLDLFSMYSSLALGYNHEIFNQSFIDEVIPLTKLRYATNAMQCDIVNDFHKLLSQHTFSPHIHFTCTGALAVESAIKTAMDYKKVKNPKVISITNSFHGVNCWGFTTDLSGFTAKRLKNFPRLDWPSISLDRAIEFLEKNDLSDIAAIIIEPVQCTNGDIYLNKEKLTTLHKLCLEQDICFILDEIQTGFGTTGKMWYYEHLGFEPDILVFGKKAQVCGIVIKEKYSNVLTLTQKKLQVTFDGDLIDMVRSKYILNFITSSHLLDQVIKLSSYASDQLQINVENYRSEGYLIAFDLPTTEQRDHFVNLCFKKNLLVNKAGERTIRLRPNLAITKNELNAAINTIKDVIRRLNEHY